MTSQVAAPTPMQKKIATFYVVPVVPNPTDTETVLYYQDGQHNEPLWVPANPKDLNARAQRCDANKVKLIQLSQQETRRGTGLPPAKLDATVRLYAGVAKTLDAWDELKSVYAAETDGSLIIDVAANSTRGLILVFTQTQTAVNGGTPPYPVARLIASTDPEIKNSTGGNIPD
ncbi:hypothetical protein [Burkholderia sp. LMU1-1-1.1]|uniref:hypothetical protein n=1 Tax=Burkholderia sp. LMU1-1-1.1 TaxID=3135266 RepID=UPI003422F7E4